jgi:hypothetical protein
MALPELLSGRILLQESASQTALGVPENESGLVEDCNLVLLLQLSSLISADDCFVDKGAVA